ncbi:hypothetical protein COLO4_07830 [Corchorus olitorius]|uniref:G-patch domain-containing protein n=1 Tax=Corchorus olitorius TaxID=93759 RepID=A0A1R3KIG7_9ROSI|nr:hypothetical protein COLO4_07830 [Corchorus olitorius]
MVQSVPPMPYITEPFRLFISGATAVGPSLLLLHASVVVPPQPFPYDLGGININNRSTLNIMTLNTLMDFPVKPAFTQVDHMMVQTCNGEMREVIGEVEVCLEIGSAPFRLIFQVMDIDAPYACLLGHPWVHMAEETLLPSGQGDKPARNHEGTILAQTSAAPHEEAGKQSYKCSSRVLEIDFVRNPKEDTFKAMQMMKKYGWAEGQGLGKNAQGMKEILLGDAQSLGFGLGFKATTEDHQILADNRDMSKGERTSLPFDKETKMEIPPLSQTFRSVGSLNEKIKQSVEETEMVTKKVSEHIICATMEGTIESHPWIHELAPGEELDNWEAYDRAVLMADLEM